jgi:hypothetical protein
MGDRHLSRSKRRRRASISTTTLTTLLNHHTGSLDEGPAATFSNVSAAVAQVAKLLKDWHWSFSTLVKQWLTFKDGQQSTYAKRQKEVRSAASPID